MVLVLVFCSQQKLRRKINKGNFFHSVTVENMKTDYFIVINRTDRGEAQSRKNFLLVNGSRIAINEFIILCHLYSYLIHGLDFKNFEKIVKEGHTVFCKSVSS